MNESPTEVTDEFGHVYMLGALLGQGGQGSVYRAKTPNIALKLISVPPGVDDKRWRQALDSRLAYLRTLPVDDREIARPLALLKDQPGYVMKLLDDMVPLGSLIGIRTIEAFRDTGGLRRRLRILARLAEALTRLHGVPLVYGDLSRNNIFVSQDVAEEEVRLIDADNMRLAVKPGPGVYTPGYGAPEVLKGRGTTSLSDAYSFAILAHEVLTLISPFEGALLEGSAWDADEESDHRRGAELGDVPWVHDPHDDRNRTNNGLAPRKVMSPRIFSLFERALGEGRHKPAERPGLREWAETLRNAADRTIRCPVCGLTSYVRQGVATCDWCNERKPIPFLQADVRRWDPEHDAPTSVGGRIESLPRQFLGERDNVTLYRHLFTPTLVSRHDIPVLSIEVRLSKLWIRRLSHELDLSYLDLSTRRFEPVPLQIELPRPQPGSAIIFRTGPSDVPHRVVVIHAPQKEGLAS